MANVDPFTIDLTPESIQDPQTLFYLNRFLHDLWFRTGGGNDLVNENIEGNVTNIGLNSTTEASLSRLTERVKELENKDLSSHFNQRIVALNQKVNELIDELLAELQDFHRPNETLQQEQAEDIGDMLEQLQLLNARVEDAFETEIDLEDLELDDDSE